MKPVRKQRLTLILLMLIGIGAAVGLALQAFNENLMYFFSTSDVVAGKAPKDTLFRLGGMVVDGELTLDGSDGRRLGKEDYDPSGLVGISATFRF